MRSLIIHPEDESTDFLKDIYSGLPDTTIITGGLKKDEVHQLIREHDRIFMLGHGFPDGLFSVGQFPGAGSLIIDRNTAPLLQDKENICIWCYADEFVNRYQLNGFYTGMFISEVGEAGYYGIPTNQQEINYSNKLFAAIVKKNLDNEEMLKKVKSEYYHSGSKVILFNRRRLYHYEERRVSGADEFRENLKKAS